MSKVMYWLQLLGKTCWSDQDPQNGPLKELQKSQNKLLRFLNKTKISDKVSTSCILKNLNMFSVNKLNAKIRLTKMWKSINLPNHTLNVRRSDLKEGIAFNTIIIIKVTLLKILVNKSTSTYSTYLDFFPFPKSIIWIHFWQTSASPKICSLLRSLTLQLNYYQFYSKSVFFIKYCVFIDMRITFKNLSLTLDQICV